MRLHAVGTGLLSALWERLLAVILKVGQQSLAVFVFSMWLAQMLGFALDFTPERGWPSTIVVNLVGCVLIAWLAYVAAWFKAQPWRTKPTR